MQQEWQLNIPSGVSHERGLGKESENNEEGWRVFKDDTKTEGEDVAERMLLMRLVTFWNP